MQTGEAETAFDGAVLLDSSSMSRLNIKPHQQNPQWNYSLLPRTS
jgi:hypothetical protein